MNGMTMKKLLGFKPNACLHVMSFLWAGSWSILNHSSFWKRGRPIINVKKYNDELSYKVLKASDLKLIYLLAPQFCHALFILHSIFLLYCKKIIVLFYQRKFHALFCVIKHNHCFTKGIRTRAGRDKFS